MKRYVREISVLGVLLLLLSFLAWRAPDFFQVQPLRSLLTREAHQRQHRSDHADGRKRVPHGG